MACVLSICDRCTVFGVEANPVKVYADASFIFPLLVAKTFAKAIEAKKAEEAAAATAAAAADATDSTSATTAAGEAK